MFVERSPISGTSSCTSPYNHNQQRDKAMSYEAASCHNSKNSPRTIPIQSPTISNSGKKQRLKVNPCGTGDLVINSSDIYANMHRKLNLMMPWF